MYCISQNRVVILFDDYFYGLHVGVSTYAFMFYNCHMLLFFDKSEEASDVSHDCKNQRIFVCVTYAFGIFI